MPAAQKSSMLIAGVGPGLGLAVARRFGREGYPVALLSRRPDRHESYLASLRQEGITAIAVAADITRPDQLRGAVTTTTEQLGPIGAVYYGPGAADPTARPAPILQAAPDDVSVAVHTFVRPAVDLTAMVLPGMLERRSGTLLYVAGLGAVVPLPGMGALAVASAALRTYALTVNVALAGTGVYAGALVIGGLVERGDIHRHAVAAVGPAVAAGLPTLDPDTIADTAGELSVRRNDSEATFNALGVDSVHA
ncbi:SDR family NAD(P)-dependent oxidoreductase [Actinoplanes sp. NPDC048791]|uniref:SDR family NAD(P)-dependent oxidoreductase n=1 Tax=Actinoplanes sp. NPDC048791 TaxID=3154623 RepID=UPI0033EB9879